MIRLRFRLWRLGVEAKRRRARARRAIYRARANVADWLLRLEERIGDVRRRITPPVPPPSIGSPFAVWRFAHLDDVGKASTHLELLDKLDERAHAAGVILGDELELRVTAPDSIDGIGVHPTGRLMLLEGRVEALA